MSIDALLQSIQAPPVAAAIRGELPGTEWLFPIVETLHVMALTVVVGSIAMIDLRLACLVSGTIPVSRLPKEVLPWNWGAWCMAAVFGSLLFTSNARVYAGNLQFQLKFTCMALAALNMLIFQFGAFRHVEQWDLGGLREARRLRAHYRCFFGSA
jgi:hypothetical protein